MKIKKWFIFTEGGFNTVPYILDLSNENVNDMEIEHCIEEQLYTTPISSNTNVEDKK